MLERTIHFLAALAVLGSPGWTQQAPHPRGNGPQTPATPQGVAPATPPTEAHAHGAGTPTTNPLIATVATKQIRLADLIDEVNRQIPLNFYHRRVPADKMAEFRRDAFEQLVVKHLIHLDAVESGLTTSDAELREEFEAALRKAGSDYQGMADADKDALFEEVRATLTRRVLIRKNEARLEQRIATPDEKMVRSLYDERIAADPSAFMAPKEAHFYHIFVAVDPARIRQEEEVKRAKIEAARRELEQGKAFAAVARVYSEDEFAAQGGDIGYQQQGAFRMAPVNDEAFALAQGELSEVIRSLRGFHLVYCADVKPPARQPFETMRPAIEQWLHDEHLKLARGRWLADLRAKYPVEVLRPELLEIGDAEPAAGAAKDAPHPTEGLAEPATGQGGAPKAPIKRDG